MGDKNTVTIRIEPEVKAAIDMVAAEMSAESGVAVTLTQAIWHLVEQGAGNVAQRINEIAGDTRIQEIKNGKKSPKQRSM